MGETAAGGVSIRIRPNCSLNPSHKALSRDMSWRARIGSECGEKVLMVRFPCSVRQNALSSGAGLETELFQVILKCDVGGHVAI